MRPWLLALAALASIVLSGGLLVPVHASHGTEIEIKVNQAGQGSSEQAVQIIVREDGQKLAIESGGSPAYLFLPQGMVTLDSGRKAYTIASYEQMLKLLTQRNKQLHENPPATPKASARHEFQLTFDSLTISGLKAQKVVELIDGKPEFDIWVSRDALPPELQAFGDKARSVLANDYWDLVEGTPGVPELTMLYGIPLRILHNGEPLLDTLSVKPRDLKPEVFEPPPDYKRIAQGAVPQN